MFQHPANVCMSYFEHWYFAMEMSGRMLYGSVTSLVHAFIPDLFITSTTDTVNKIQSRLKEVGCRD